MIKDSLIYATHWPMHTLGMVLTIRREAEAKDQVQRPDWQAQNHR